MIAVIHQKRLSMNNRAHREEFIHEQGPLMEERSGLVVGSYAERMIMATRKRYWLAKALSEAVAKVWKGLKRLENSFFDLLT